MKTRLIEPTGIYAPSADYAHAIEITNAARTVYVAGTMGLDADGSANPSIDHQLEKIWGNISAILKAADMGVDNIVRMTTYLSDRAYAEKNTAARMKALKGRVVPTTAIVCDLYDSSWLVEIEVIAMG